MLPQLSEADSLSPLPHALQFFRFWPFGFKLPRTLLPFEFRMRRVLCDLP
jgi:hypothetical protein